MGIGAWESLPNAKITIAIPHVGLVFFEWAVRLRELMMPSGTIIQSLKGLPIDFARNKLVKLSMENKSDYIFFLDSDVTCPADTLYKLLSDNLPIVSGIYRNKTDGLPAAWRLIPNPTPTGKYAPLSSFGGDGHLEKVDVVGMGCCLINMEVFKRVKYPWFKWGIDIYSSGVSEDFAFCEKAKEAGLPTYIDCRVICEHEELAVLGTDFKQMKKTTL